jgi:hypothetical protein
MVSLLSQKEKPSTALEQLTERRVGAKAMSLSDSKGYVNDLFCLNSPKKWRQGKHPNLFLLGKKVKHDKVRRFCGRNKVCRMRRNRQVGHLDEE